jgi:NAD-dependent dihydropyrimidine dehydrogenase PreA subunit
VRPYENIITYIDKAKAWGVQECLCRNQKELIGDPCDHPKEVCMSLSMRPGMFDHHPAVRALTRDEALDKLKEAADAGLVHQVSNSQEGNTEGLLFVCNCCSCSCGILRGMAEMGVANVVAKSSFINTVDEDLCNGCEDCLEYCQFDALKMDDLLVTVSAISCTGCGVCVPSCTTGALSLIRRAEEEIPEIPVTENDWKVARSEARGLDISKVR